MKTKGFTLVELITTFALTAVIVVLLINLILVIKNLYSNTDSKTKLYINQNSLSNAMNSKIRHGNLVSYDVCDDSEFCYVFNYLDNTSDKLVITENTISFGNLVYNFDSKTNIEGLTITTENISTNGFSKIINIKIPIKNELYPSVDFGINLVYQME